LSWGLCTTCVINPHAAFKSRLKTTDALHSRPRPALLETQLHSAFRTFTPFSLSAMRTCPHCGRICNSLFRHLSQPTSSCYKLHWTDKGVPAEQALHQLQLIAPEDEDYSAESGSELSDSEEVTSVTSVEDEPSHPDIIYQDQSEKDHPTPSIQRPQTNRKALKPRSNVSATPSSGAYTQLSHSTRNTIVSYMKTGEQILSVPKDYRREQVFNDRLDPATRRAHPFHPFKSAEEWEFLSTLEAFNLSGASVDAILSTTMVSHSLDFRHRSVTEYDSRYKAYN
jgi:hypothetical protein